MYSFPTLPSWLFNVSPICLLTTFICPTFPFLNSHKIKRAMKCDFRPAAAGKWELRLTWFLTIHSFSFFIVFTLYRSLRTLWKLGWIPIKFKRSEDDLISFSPRTFLVWKSGRLTAPPNQLRRDQWDGKIILRLKNNSYPTFVSCMIMHNNSFARCPVTNSIMLAVSNQIKWGYHRLTQHETLSIESQIPTEFWGFSFISSLDLQWDEAPGLSGIFVWFSWTRQYCQKIKCFSPSKLCWFTFIVRTEIRRFIFQWDSLTISGEICLKIFQCNSVTLKSERGLIC